VSDFGPAVTEHQWNRIRRIVHDKVLRARAAEPFPSVYKPLPGGSTTLPADGLLRRRKESLGFWCRGA
jgi:hypothetical protein